MAIVKNPHNGGVQIPMFTPHSDWRPPTELPDLRGLDLLAVDVETRDETLQANRGSGWAYRAGFVAGVAIAWRGGKMYVPVRHPEDNYREPQNVGPWLGDVIRSAKRVVAHKAQYDFGWLTSDPAFAPHVAIPDSVEDTIAAAVMVDENRFTYGLDDLCAWRGLPGKDEALLREAANAFVFDPKKDLWRLPARYVGAYASQDPEATIGLLDDLEKTMAKEETLQAYELECGLIPLTIAMRKRGVRLNVDAAAEAADMLRGKRDDVLRELGTRLGRGGAVSIDHCRSVKHLESWFDAEAVSYPRTAKTNVGSFTKTWMKDHEHWLPSLVARATQLDDAAHKFIEGYLIGYAHRGRLHAEVNQFRTEDGAGTRSHRFSYSDPPLQQMPAREEEIAAKVRGAFEADEGEVFVAPDYSQQEYRLIVHYAAAMRLPGGEEAAARYRDDPKTDFHEYVMELTGLERKPAKNTNFAKAYGALVPKFAEMTGRTIEEAREIYDLYDRELPFVSRLAQRCEGLAATRGFIRLIDGARCHFDDWTLDRRDCKAIGKWPPREVSKAEAEKIAQRFADETGGLPPRVVRAGRKGMSRLIQGSAARQTKQAMLDCHRAGISPLLQIHDELGFSLKRERDARDAAEIMIEVGRKEKLVVPMRVDLEWGGSWGTVEKATKRTWREAGGS